MEFNTQTSSQWDSFRHWSYPDGRFYNGVTQDDVRKSKSVRNGIQGQFKLHPLSIIYFSRILLSEWTKKGIVGRGVLIDYYSYVLEQGMDYEPWTFHEIPVSAINAIADEKGIIFQPGDILFLRTGTPFLSTAMCPCE